MFPTPEVCQKQSREFLVEKLKAECVKNAKHADQLNSIEEAKKLHLLDVIEKSSRYANATPVRDAGEEWRLMAETFLLIFMLVKL